MAAEVALQGFDVLSQAGRTDYSYDLSVASTRGMMKIMVHGSLDGLWDLVDPNLAATKPGQQDDHRAIDLWLERYRRVACCLVEFDAANLGGMPRIYLTTAAELARMLHENVAAAGELRLGRHASLPQRWRFTEERIAEVMGAGGENQPPKSPQYLPMVS
ncbi:MAG: hypothetical protein ACRD3S_19250 [Terracidiphilus sp.]